MTLSRSTLGLLHGSAAFLITGAPTTWMHAVICDGVQHALQLSRRQDLRSLEIVSGLSVTVHVVAKVWHTEAGRIYTTRRAVSQKSVKLEPSHCQPQRQHFCPLAEPFLQDLAQLRLD